MAQLFLKMGSVILNLKFNYIDGDSRDNKWFVSLGKHTGKSKKSEEEYQPISLDYFMKMRVAGGTGGKEIITQNNTLKTVRDIYMFYSVGGSCVLSSSDSNTSAFIMV